MPKVSNNLFINVLNKSVIVVISCLFVVLCYRVDEFLVAIS